MTTPVQAALEAAVIKELAARNKTTRAEVEQMLEPGDRKTAYLGDGPTKREIGSVRLDRPKSGYRIADRDQFVAWVQANHPAAIVMVPTVVPLWEASVLKQGSTPDGEVPDGIEWVEGKPTFVVTPNDAAAELARVLLGDALKELES